MRSRLLLCFAVLACFGIQGSYGIEVTLIDTKLCSQKISSAQKKALQDFQAEECSNQELKVSKKNHANQVLDVLFTHLPQNQNIKLTHKNIFDLQGKHSEKLWKKAIQKLQTLPAQLVLLAVGSNKADLFALKLPTKHFYLMASGQMNNQYAKNATLWPQKLLIQNEVKGVMIGAYTGVEEKTSADQAPALAPRLLHQKSIDYLFPNSSLKNELKGSSHAVSVAAAQLIKKCGKRPLDLWRKCLKKNQRELILLRDLKRLTF